MKLAVRLRVRNEDVLPDRQGVKSMRQGDKLLLGLGLALLGWPATAGAECSTDADCPAGQVCAPADCPAVACDPDGECPPPASCDESAGECVDAWGSDCATDGDCPAGWICEVLGLSSCAAPYCPPEGECPAPPECEPEEFRGCVPPPPPSCQADADCAAGLVCLTFSYTDCPDGRGVPANDTCAPGEECGSANADDGASDAEAECVEQTEGYCVPRYVAPCTQDADCGPGFTCEQAEACRCSGSRGAELPPAPDSGSGSDGSGGSSDGSSDDGSSDDGSSDDGSDDGSSDDGSSDDGSSDECLCEPTGQTYCALIEQDCTADAECPTGLTCQEILVGGSDCAVTRPSDPSGGSSAQPPGPDAPAEEAGGDADDDTDEACEDADERVPRCLPPDWVSWAGTATASDLTDGQEPGRFEEALAGSLGVEEVARGAGAPADQDDGTGDPTGAEGDGFQGRSDDGCSLIAGAGLPADLGLLLLLGAALALLRRA